MVRSKIIIWLVLCLICWETSPAQVLDFETISVENLKVNHVSQDHNGLIWIATEAGLYDWTPLRGARIVKGQGDAVPDVREVIHTSSASWALTTTGLLRISEENLLVAHSIQDLRESRITDIEEDAQGNIWFLGTSQIFLLQPNGDQRMWALRELNIRGLASLSAGAEGVWITDGFSKVLLGLNGIQSSRNISSGNNKEGFSFFTSDSTIICQVLQKELRASRRGQPESTIKLADLGDQSRVFQDHALNLWVVFADGALRILTPDKLESLFMTLEFQQEINTEDDEYIQTAAAYENRAVFLTNLGNLLWCNRLRIRKRWDLPRGLEASLVLTRNHILIWKADLLGIISLADEELTFVEIPGLHSVEGAGERVTFGLENFLYFSLDKDQIQELSDCEDPASYLSQIHPKSEEMFSRQVLYTSERSRMVRDDNQVEVVGSGMDGRGRLQVREGFQSIHYWREDTLIGLKNNGALHLITASGSQHLPLACLGEYRATKLALAPERDLIWVTSSEGVTFQITGIPNLIQGQLATCFHHEKGETRDLAWNRYLLRQAENGTVDLLVAPEKKIEPGKIRIASVQWDEKVPAWSGIKPISTDSSVFSVEFESGSLVHPAQQVLEVRINDEPWEIAENGMFTTRQLSTGIHRISARLRAGELIVDHQENILRFSLRAPFYQSWWFLFIGAVMLVGLIWAGFSLYYGDSERKRLELQVHTRTRDLDHSVHELKQKNEDLEQFAYIASHDLKSPLRGMIGHLQLFQRKYEPMLDEAGLESLHFTIHESKRLYAMVNDLLDFASVGTGKLEKKRTSMNMLLETVRQSVLLQQKDKEVCIHLEDCPEMFIAPSQFEALFRNLIENGIKFNDSEQVRVSVQYQCLDGKHQFRVTDNGIGIDRTYAHKAFELYGRLHPEYPGTGIGLAICRRVVERHGGMLELEDTEETGSTFLISLPVV